MTIFIINSPYKTAKILDPKRLNKQVLECQWMIDMAEGKTKEKNHPAYLMYKNHIEWIKLYQRCLSYYRDYLKHNDGDELLMSITFSNEADKIKPPFLCQELYDNFRKRLYTKNPEYYSDFAEYGKTEANYYFVDGNWLKYENGKKEVDNDFAPIPQ